MFSCHEISCGVKWKNALRAVIWGELPRFIAMLPDILVSLWVMQCNVIPWRSCNHLIFFVPCNLMESYRVKRPLFSKQLFCSAKDLFQYKATQNFKVLPQHHFALLRYFALRRNTIPVWLRTTSATPAPLWTTNNDPVIGRKNLPSSSRLAGLLPTISMASTSANRATAAMSSTAGQVVFPSRSA